MFFVTYICIFSNGLKILLFAIKKHRNQHCQPAGAMPSFEPKGLFFAKKRGFLPSKNTETHRGFVGATGNFCLGRDAIPEKEAD
jgi:hypothetical protein